MRKKIGFKDSRAFGVGSLMPRGLKHWPDKDQPFDPRGSEVIQWLHLSAEIRTATQKIYSEIQTAITAKVFSAYYCNGKTPVHCNGLCSGEDLPHCNGNPIKGDYRVAVAFAVNPSPTALQPSDCKTPKQYCPP